MQSNLIERVVKWNEDRLIPQKFDKVKEAGHIAEELSELLRANTASEELDALCDIVVFAIGAIWKKKFDVHGVFDETLKEIEDRGGYFDVKAGKWMKVEKPDRYKADYQRWNCCN
jgi:hypothetical protein